MALAHFEEYFKLMPLVKKSPNHGFWSSYDEDADVLYVNFKKPSYATDSELTDDDILVRYQGSKIIGFTILNASKRKSKK